jgi:hypothetical protein
MGRKLVNKQGASCWDGAKHGAQWSFVLGSQLRCWHQNNATLQMGSCKAHPPNPMC